MYYLNMIAKSLVLSKTEHLLSMSAPQQHDPQWNLYLVAFGWIIFPSPFALALPTFNYFFITAMPPFCSTDVGEMQMGLLRLLLCLLGPRWTNGRQNCCGVHLGADRFEGQEVLVNTREKWGKQLEKAEH